MRHSTDYESPDSRPDSSLRTYLPVTVVGVLVGLCFFAASATAPRPGEGNAIVSLSAPQPTTSLSAKWPWPWGKPAKSHPHEVVGLPDLPFLAQDLKMFAGFLPTNKDKPELDSHLFYWLLESEAGDRKKETPLILWLNGGPGASSLTGVLMENGPIRMELDGSISWNPYGWTKVGHMLAVDQPVGAGFSYTKSEPSDKFKGEVDGPGYINNLDEMAEQLYEVISGVVEQHEWLKDCPLYITGESYAGKYIPMISYYIHMKNKAAGKKLVNLEGIAIGNGEVKPFLAYSSTPDYLHALGYLDDDQLEWAHKGLAKCKEYVDKEDWAGALKACDEDMQGVMYAKYVQVPFIYDVRAKIDMFTSLTAKVTAWINKPEVHAALNVGKFPWRQSDGQGPGAQGKPVPEHLRNEQMRPINDTVLVTLMENYQFMFYSGQFDGSACNFYATKRMLDALEWKGKDAYMKTERSVWKVGSAAAGYFKGDVAGFSFLLVSNSGHLVPTDQPENALDMISRFIEKQPFD